MSEISGIAELKAYEIKSMQNERWQRCYIQVGGGIVTKSACEQGCEDVDGKRI